MLMKEIGKHSEADAGPLVLPLSNPEQERNPENNPSKQRDQENNTMLLLAPGLDKNLFSIPLYIYKKLTSVLGGLTRPRGKRVQ